MSEGGLYLEDVKGHGWIIREMRVLHLCFINKIGLKEEAELTETFSTFFFFFFANYNLNM